MAKQLYRIDYTEYYPFFRLFPKVYKDGSESTDLPLIELSEEELSEFKRVSEEFDALHRKLAEKSGCEMEHYTPLSMVLFLDI